MLRRAQQRSLPNQEPNKRLRRLNQPQTEHRKNMTTSLEKISMLQPSQNTKRKLLRETIQLTILRKASKRRRSLLRRRNRRKSHKTSNRKGSKNRGDHKIRATTKTLESTRKAAMTGTTGTSHSRRWCQIHPKTSYLSQMASHSTKRLTKLKRRSSS